MMTLSFKYPFLVIALTVGLITSAKPLSETMATALSIAGGAVVGLGVGGVTYWANDGAFDSEVPRWITSGLAGAGTGGITWYFLNQWLHSKTPTARIAAAALLISSAVREVRAIERDLNNALIDKVVTKNFATNTDFIANVNARFGTSWPLVLAREYLTNLPGNFSNRVAGVKSMTIQAQNPLNTALAEMRSSSGYSQLISEGERLGDTSKQVLIQCDQLNQPIQTLREVIEASLTTIVQHEKFDFQVSLYEKHLEAERQRRHAEEETRRQRAHESTLQSNSLSHDSVERWCDRTHDSTERSRDRFSTALNNERKYQHQNNVLNSNRYRPVTLNVG